MKTYSLKSLREEQYIYHKKRFPYLFNFFKNPYSFLKAIFYMELSAIFVWMSVRVNVSPNTITVVYGLAGILTGILLALPSYYAVLSGVFIAFTKGILDWSDGHLARVTGKTSSTGALLDGYGALLNSLGFQVGIGLYLANQTAGVTFYYLLILLLFLRAGSSFIFSKAVLFQNLSDKDIIDKYKKRQKNSGSSTSSANKNILDKSKYAHYLNAFFDDRARNVDFICFVILVELHTEVNLLWLIFILIIIKYFLIFTGFFFMIAKGGWVENRLMNKVEEIEFLMNDDK